MIDEFLQDYAEADMVTGHNLLRFDLPVLNADMIRLGLGVLPEKLVQDTMKLKKTKGLKKGQGNLAIMLGVRAKKRDMDWADWDAAYEWDAVIEGDVFVDWSKVVERCVTDVKQHKQLRKRLLEEGLLKSPILWKP